MEARARTLLFLLPLLIAAAAAVLFVEGRAASRSSPWLLAPAEDRRAGGEAGDAFLP
jgi:hypothetical protein